MRTICRRVPGATRLSSSACSFLWIANIMGAVPAVAQNAVAGAKSAPSHGLAAMDAAEAAEAAKDEIVVTGQQQHGAVATDVSPEVKLNAATISALGAADLNEVFEDLAPEFRSGASPPGKAAQTPIVLVNGQRIAGFSSIKDLPPEAVRRIEVFPEKVALQYGYGADQKVVNVVLRTNYHALTLLGRYTAAPESWRGIYRAKADLLRIGENSHWNVDLDFSHLDPIFAESTIGDSLAGAESPPVPRHTFAAQNDDLTVSGDLTRNFGPVAADFTARLDMNSLQSRLGLTQEDGEQLAGEGSPDMISGPRYRSDRNVDARTSLALNGNLDSWRWSFIGQLDEQTREVLTAGTSEAGSFEGILLPSPGLLGERCAGPITGDCAVTTTRTASGDLYLNGKLISLPAGSVTTSLRAGFALSDLDSQSLAAGEGQHRIRNEGHVQGNIDVPVTSRDSPVGKMSIGLNGEARQLSDFGTLSTIGSTLQWTPVKPVEIIASVRDEDQTPSLQQLGDATLITPDLREFDFVTNQTSIVQRSEGGDDALQRSKSKIASVRLQLMPIKPANLQLSAEYTIDHTRDPFVSVTAATIATMEALPELFTRNTAGYLTSINASPLNLAQRARQQVRLGLNYSTAFGPANPEPGPDGKFVARDQFQIALYDTWRLQDDVVLRNGLPRLNLLNGDFISDLGGTPTHEVELQTTISTRTWSADVNARWQTPTVARAGLAADDRLTFADGVTVNLRLQINLAEQPWLMRALPFLRGRLNLSADNILGAHTTVHDQMGVVPSAYSESYLNPTGRTFRITLRKRFH
jgi:iron complex outermembrane receptor protein